MDMDPQYILGLVARWAHILAAVTVVGGTIFMRFAMVPAAGQLPDQMHMQLRESVRRRWVWFVIGAITFLIVSGLYNFFITVREIPEDNAFAKRWYNILFGFKFLLAMAIFFIGSVSVGRSTLGQRFRQNLRYWLSLNIVLAVILICISGAMRSLHLAFPPAP